MIQQFFLGFTLIGSQWVLWLLMFLSITSFALIFERYSHFRKAFHLLNDEIQTALQNMAPQERTTRGQYLFDSMIADTRLKAEKRLGWLATISSNAPFIGLFGTVLGIIRAFHDLSLGTPGSTTNSGIVTAGISEALVATAVGLFVAIPAAVAYNHFHRKIKDLLLSAEKTKNSIFALKA
ncbi:MAG: MotA/TolQ/ExbB proton channel family protein [Bacteriovoracia bacterium]